MCIIFDGVIYSKFYGSGSSSNNSGTVKPLIFAGPLFRQFHHVNKSYMELNTVQIDTTRCRYSALTKFKNFAMTHH